MYESGCVFRSVRDGASGSQIPLALFQTVGRRPSRKRLGIYSLRNPDEYIIFACVAIRI